MSQHRICDKHIKLKRLENHLTNHVHVVFYYRVYIVIHVLYKSITDTHNYNLGHRIIRLKIYGLTNPVSYEESMDATS